MRYIVGFILVVLLSCKSSSNKSSQMDFPSGKYQVTTLNHENYKPAKDYILNVDAEKNNINGTFDCNTFNIGFERNGNEVKFGYAMATKMYCEGDMHNESSFLNSTQSISTYTYKKGELVFYDSNKGVILELKHVESE